MSAGGGRVRVLMLVDYLSALSGGGERFAVGLAAHLPRDRFEVALCATRQIEEPWAGRLREAGVRSLALDRRRTADLLPLRRLGAVLRRQHVDVLHAHMYGSNVWGTIVGRLARVPVVVAHEHTWSYEGQPVRRVLDGRLIGRGADAFVAVSGRDRDRMIAVEHVPAEKIVVEPTGFVPRAPGGGSGDLRAELGIAADAPVVGTMAIMRPQKALHVLVDAFARLLEHEPRAHLVLAGDGECRAALERQARERRLDGRVHFAGLREDVEAVVGTFDVAAMSSDFEGTPLFAIECMALGTPVVSTDVGGLRDMVEPGRSALLVPPADPDALAGALASLLADPARRAALAAAGRERAAHYTMDAVAARFAALYERLLAGRPPRP